MELNVDKCVQCNKNIGMDIDFGGNPEVQPCNPDGDGFVCSNACKRAYDEKISRQMDAEFGGARS